MGALETLSEHKFAVGAAVILVVVVVVGAVGVPALIGFLQDVQESGGNVTIEAIEDERGTTLEITVEEMRKSEYMNVVINGGTDRPRSGVVVEEAAEITVTPPESAGPIDRSDPMDGPPDADADSAGDVIRVRGLQSGDTVHVIGVRSGGGTTTKITVAVYTV